jgi:hypothetical protein
MDHCDECGYRYDSLARDALADTIRAFGPAYASLLARPGDDLRAHPTPGVWSVLEYACHLRDVLNVQRTRIELALQEDQPKFTSMRREERVVEEGYNEQDPQRVARELRAAAEALAQTLDRLDEHGWGRTGVYNWPTTEVRTLDWVARHTVHEGRHHIMDIERLLEALS